MRFKHGHSCNIAVEANGISPGAEQPSVRLRLEKVTSGDAGEASGHEQLQGLVRAHDAGEALPVEALARLIDALRVFAAGGELEAQLKQFALEAGLVANEAMSSLLQPGLRHTAATSAGPPTALRGTTALEAALNLHCRTLRGQADMAKLGAALRETLRIVVRMRTAGAGVTERPVQPEDEAAPAALDANPQRLANAFVV